MVIVRFLLMTVWFYSASFVCFVVALFRPFRNENSVLFTRLVMPTALRILNLKVETRHAERLLSSQPCVYIANHQYLTDLFLFGSIMPPRTLTIGKKSLRLIPIFGWMYWLSGHILIDRADRDRALATINAAKRAITQRGCSIFICPEGTRSRGRGLRAFKKGAFHLAIEAGVPLQPMVAASIEKRVNYWRWNSGTVPVDMLEPIPTKGLRLADVDRLAEEAHRRIKEAIDRMDAELSG